MIKCIAALCAEKVLVDGRSNSISAISIIERIQFQGQLLILPQVSCLYLLQKDEGDPDEFDLQVIVKSNGEVLFQSPVHALFKGQKTNRLVADIAGVPITTPGFLTFEIAYESQPLGCWEIPVEKTALITPTITTTPVGGST